MLRSLVLPRVVVSEFPRAPTSDALCCSHTVTVSTYGLRLLIRTNDPVAAARFSDLLPPLARTTGAATWNQSFTIRNAGRCQCRVKHSEVDTWIGQRFLQSYDSLSFDLAFDRLGLVIKHYVALYAHGRAFVHAGAVAWQGRGIVIPGRSMAGKSTLVDALARLGAVYYSDEYAVIDSRGRLHPFPQPLAMRTSASGLTQSDRDPIAEGFEVGTTAIPIGLVVSTAYKAISRWKPRSMTRGETVLELLDNCVAAQHAPHRVIAAITAATGSTDGVKGNRGDAPAAAARILELADSSKKNVARR